MSKPSWKKYAAGRSARQPGWRGRGGSGSSQTPTTPPKFTSEGDRLIYALVKLDGGARMDELGLTRSLYSDRDAAKKWYRNIAKLIHPDKSNNPMASAAFAVLEGIYANVKG